MAKKSYKYIESTWETNSDNSCYNDCNRYCGSINKKTITRQSKTCPETRNQNFFYMHYNFGPAKRISSDMFSNFLKLSTNICASFFAERS